MKNFELKTAVMLEEHSVEVTRELIGEMLMDLGNIVEDVDHYPTLPDSVEELADLLEIEIDQATDEVVAILEEIVIDHRNYTYERLRWNDLLRKEVF